MSPTLISSFPIPKIESITRLSFSLMVIVKGFDLGVRSTGKGFAKKKLPMLYWSGTVLPVLTVEVRGSVAVEREGGVEEV